ncbi:MAG: metallophosphoesterase [Dehalococcoidia bacterium]
MPAVRTNKQRPTYLQPLHAPKEFPRFEPVPISLPTSTTLPLSAIIGDTSGIQAHGQIVFHGVGDTGGFNGTDAQEAVANTMEAQIAAAADNLKPAFFYHLGDVIYYNGQSSLYSAQFYEPYKFYPAPIVAIPGNHDGDTHVRPPDPPDSEPSLAGFRTNFCDSQRRHLDTYRDTMTQPYVYWTLQAPFVTIIGLYGNVDGLLDGPGTAVQQQWLTAQLRQADQNACLIIAVHQPPYSLDDSHGGYPAILTALDQAVHAAGRWPDAVLSGHVHNYQRFTRTVAEPGAGATREIPYLVAGAGGYARTSRALHKLNRNPNDPANPPVPCPIQTLQPDVELRGYHEAACGFLRVTVTDQRLTIEYFAVPFVGQPPVAPFDAVTVTYRTGRIENQMAPGTTGAEANAVPRPGP